MGAMAAARDSLFEFRLGDSHVRRGPVDRVVEVAMPIIVIRRGSFDDGADGDKRFCCNEKIHDHSVGAGPLGDHVWLPRGVPSFPLL